LPLLKNIDALIRSLFLPKADVYLCEGGTDILTVLPRKILNPKIKIICIIASSYGVIGVTNPISKFIMRILINKCDGAIAVSDYIRNSLRHERINIPIEIVEPYVDIERFRKVNVNLTTNNFLYIGRNHYERNISFLKEIFKENKYQLTLIGNGFKNKRIKNIIERSATKNIEKYMKLNTFFIDLSLFAPFPVAVLEAMSAGMVPIVSINCGNEYLVRKVDPELVIDEYEKNIVLKRINKILKKPIKWRKEISNNVRKVVKHLTKENQCKLFKEKFSILIKDN
jgi:glycosyltransferase involved in cell wall biosynthesis